MGLKPENKRLIDSFIKVALAGSMVFGLPSLTSCSSKSDSEKQSVERVKHYCSVEEAEYYVVFHNDEFVMIIPAIYFDYSDSGYCYAKTYCYEGNNGWEYDYFSPNMIEYITCDYTSAKNYSSMLSDEFFLYRDVVEGNPVNIDDYSDDAKVLTKN